MQVNTSAIGAITPYSKHSFLVKFSFMRSFPIMSKNSFIIFLFKICIIQIPVLHYSNSRFALFKFKICIISVWVAFALIASWRMNLAKSSLISFSVIVIFRKMLIVVCHPSLLFFHSPQIADILKIQIDYYTIFQDLYR